MKINIDKVLDILSKGFLIGVILGILSLVMFNIKRNHIIEHPQTKEDSEKIILFFPEFVDSITLVNNEKGYYANVYYMGDTLWTSYKEGEVLIKNLKYAYANYEEDSIALEEALGTITDNSEIIVTEDSTLILSLWYVRK